MTKDELKKFLHSYKDLESERRQIAAELEKVEALMASPKAQNLTGMPRTPGVSDPVFNMVDVHVTLVERYQAQLRRLAAAQTAIETLIEGLEPLTRQLMRYRYIDGLRWEEVCVAIGYSWRHTHNIHAKALDDLLEREVEHGED